MQTDRDNLFGKYESILNTVFGAAFGVIGTLTRPPGSQLLPVLPELVYFSFVALLSVCIIAYVGTVARVIARSGRLRRIRCAASLLIIAALNTLVAIIGAALEEIGVSNSGKQLAVILCAWILCYFVTAWWAAFLGKRNNGIEQ